MTTKELENYTPKGDLTGFPKEIIARMLECQEEQGNPRDVTVFEIQRDVIRSDKGFNWDKTQEDWYFWYKVIDKRNFDLFFGKYPKQETKVCSKCHKEKSLSEFHKRGNRARSECKECRKQEYQKSKTNKYVQVDDNVILSDITSTQSSVEIKINTTEDSSQEFRVGDKVYDILLKEVGIIQDIIYSSTIPYGLSTEFKSGVKSYTVNGCYIPEYKNPHLLHYRDDYDYSIIDFNNLPKRQEPKRWRAKKGEYYYAITTPAFKIGNYFDVYIDSDNNNYNSGNYFQTEKQAQEVADKLKEYFKQLIEENHN